MPDDSPPPCEHGARLPKPPGLGDVDAYRAYYRRYRQPRLYAPRLHLLVHLGPVALCAWWALSQLVNVHAIQLLIIPAGLVGASYFVFWFHRDVLHRRRRWDSYAYRHHTLEHHRFFDFDHIVPDGLDDLHITLFPWFTGAGLALIAWAQALLLGPLIGHNVAHLITAIACIYMITYEAVHTIAHLPKTHILARVPGLRFLREHHRLHHDPAMMGKYNFNIVIPLFDWISGTLIRDRK